MREKVMQAKKHGHPEKKMALMQASERRIVGLPLSFLAIPGFKSPFMRIHVYLCHHEQSTSRAFM